MSKEASFTRWSIEPYCIGMKLRALRNRKRLTLSRLAAETGLSTALLSKLETDRMIPTLPTLATISRVYGVGLSHFFSEPARHSLSITRKAHLQGKGRLRESAQHMPLCAAGQKAPFSAKMIELAPEAALQPTNGGAVTCVLYVIEGKLRIDAVSVRETLEAGDCACIDSQAPMTWSSASKERCRVLTVQPGQPQPA